MGTDYQTINVDKTWGNATGERKKKEPKTRLLKRKRDFLPSQGFLPCHWKLCEVCDVQKWEERKIGG